jgi:hypothetical protein
MALPNEFLHQAKSVMSSLEFAPPELETLHFGRLCEYTAEVCEWDRDAGTALATVLLYRSREGLRHLVEQIEKPTTQGD